jgi:diguanylate cyclase (GGDEF)-like protein
MNDNYTKILLNHLEPTYNKLTLIGSVVVGLTAVLVFVENGLSNLFFYLDVILALFLFIMYFFRDKIQIRDKIIIILFLVLMLGSMQVFYGGLLETGVLLFFLSSVLGIIFLNRIFGLFTIIYSSVFLFLVTYLLSIGVIKFDNGYLNNDSNFWLIYSVTFLITALVLLMSVFTMKKHLAGYLENIELGYKELERTKKELEEQYYQIKEKNEINYVLAYKDKLTGINNRYALKNFVKEDLENAGLSNDRYLLVLDLADLKNINAIFGWSTGDEILKTLTQGLKKYFEKDIIGRTGDKEFGIFTTSIDLETLLEDIENLKDFIIQNIDFMNIKSNLHLFIGYSRYFEDGYDFDELYQTATVAVKYAKDHQYLQPIRYDSNIFVELSEIDSLRKDVERGIMNEEFFVQYQQKVNAKTLKVVGVEALARWTSPKRGFVPPNVFIPIIDNSNLIIPFSEMIIQRIFKDFKRIIELYGKITVSINISPIHLIYKDFATFMMNQCSLYSIPPEQIELEITENIMVQEFATVDLVIKQLRNTGFKIALDDFGTGYSSLKYLEKIHIDVLKIDKSFIQSIDTNSKTRVLVESIINIGKANMLEIVAEGVETKDQFEILKEIDCDLIQGYYFSRPTSI